MTTERRDRDVFTDIADHFLAIFGMARSYTQDDYTLAAPGEES